MQIEGAAIQANDQKSIRVESVTKGMPPDYEDVLQFTGTPFLIPVDYITATEEIPGDEEITSTNIENADGNRNCWLTFPRNVLAGRTGAALHKAVYLERPDHTKSQICLLSL